MTAIQHPNGAAFRAAMTAITRGITAGPIAWGCWLSSTSILEGIGLLFIEILVLSAITAPIPLDVSLRGAIVSAASFAIFATLLVIGLRGSDERP
jgi:hypothetical protein